MKYNIDCSKVYENGFSGDGETMSQVMGKRPDLVLYTAAGNVYSV